MSLSIEDVSYTLALVKSAAKEFNSGNYPSIDKLVELVESKSKEDGTAIAFLFKVLYDDALKGEGKK